MGLREAHGEKVACNKVRVDGLWARPCRAHNVQIELDLPTKASLRETQRTLKRTEPNLPVCPQKTLHVSVAWLLGVRASYPVAKASLWERHGGEWTAELNRIAAQGAGFWIAYEHVVANDSAVVVLARPTEPVNRIRGIIRERLRLPPETRNEADLVHTTLFRYHGSLSDPATFLATLDARAPRPRSWSTSWSSRRSWCTRRLRRKCSRASRSLPGKRFITPCGRWSRASTPRRRSVGRRTEDYPPLPAGLYLVLVAFARQKEKCGQQEG